MNGPQSARSDENQLQAVSLKASWLIIPSWFGSILFHGLLGVVILFLSQLPAFRRDVGGDGGESYRYAGIQLLPPGAPGPAGTPGSPDEKGNGTANPPPRPGPAGETPAANAQAPAPAPSSLPPIALNLPEVAPQAMAVIGPGAPQGLTSVKIDSLVKPANNGLGGMPGGGLGGSGDVGNGTGGFGGTGTGSGGGGGGGTTFLGVKGTGKRFVYVIDRSFSMASDNALQAAKLELLASLQRLNETQQFQVIFYNTEYVVLNARGGRFDMFRGTDTQRLLVTEQIREMAPAEGTRHLPAILEALNFKPDVIFLLSDGDATTALDMKDLETIRLQNRGKTHLNCIEFGRAAKSNLGEAGNFLKVLAKENGGQYVYRNLKAGF